MVKASLSLEAFNSKGITSQMASDFAKDWQNIPHISSWLKVKGFELTKPILVSNENNSLTFFQKGSETTSRKVVIIHPIAENLKILSDSFKLAGHEVFAFDSSEEAIKRITNLVKFENSPEFVILPKNLRTSSRRTVSLLINQLFPQIKIKETAEVVQVESDEDKAARKKVYAEQGQQMRFEKFRKAIEQDQDIDKETKFFIVDNIKTFQEVFLTVNHTFRLSLWAKFLKLAESSGICSYDLKTIWKYSRNVI